MGIGVLPQSQERQELQKEQYSRQCQIQQRAQDLKQFLGGGSMTGSFGGQVRTEARF